MTDRPTGLFTPASGLTGADPAADAAKTEVLPSGEEPDPEEPPAEIYTIEELDRLLHGEPPKQT